MGLAPKLTTRAIPINTHKKSSSVSARALYMAGVERFELPTRGFGIRCSANWSYTPSILKNPSIAARVWNKWRSGRDSNPRPPA